MGLILLEALVALLIVAVFVWWTMFSARREADEPRDDTQKNSENDGA